MKQTLRQSSSLFDNTGAMSDSFNPEFKRLGIYFEKLVLHALQQNNQYDLLQSNYQVRGNGHTLGEYDAILLERLSNDVIHCEIAVKFYLQINSGSELADWVGPGLHDRLDLKYERLISHQLMLGEKAQDNGLNDLDVMPTEHKSLLTRGRLYYAFENFITQQFVYPKEVYKGHLKGFWIAKDAFESFKRSNAEITWYDLPKPYWLAPFTAEDIELLRPFDTEKLVGAKQVVGIKDKQELMRGFVVTQDWISASARANEIT